MNYKLAPSSFSFLYEGCKRCFYLKVVHGINQPSKPLPGVFSKIAGLLKDHYNGKRTEELHPDLPAGVVSHGEKRVKSKAIQLPSYQNTCYISGRFDIVVHFDDDTYGVIDFKTGNPKDEYNELYARQLYAYAHALENPALGALGLSPITKLGLLYFHPERTKQERLEQLLYESDIHWIETERNDEKFMNFIDEVLSILELSTPPDPSPDCEWCNYIDKLNRLNGVTLRPKIKTQCNEEKLRR